MVYKAIHERDVHPSFHCSKHFCSPFCCSWWFGRTQNKATTRLPSILCGWSGRLEQSTTRHRSAPTLWTFKHMLKIFFLAFLLYRLTVSRVRAANIVRRPCSDSIAMLQRLINCRYIIINLLLRKI